MTIATTIPPAKDEESAIAVTLNPGAYTAVVGSANGNTGIGLVEVYDLDAIQDSTLANISTRGFIQTGNDVMIGGLIYLGGPGLTKVVVRGIGPSLAVKVLSGLAATELISAIRKGEVERLVQLVAGVE